MKTKLIDKKKNSCCENWNLNRKDYKKMGLPFFDEKWQALFQEHISTL